MLYQTRSEKNGLKHFSSMKEALDHAENIDTTIWKISFDLPCGARMRLEKKDQSQVGGDWVWCPYDGIFDPNRVKI